MTDNIYVRDAVGTSSQFRTTDLGDNLHVPHHRLNSLTLSGPATQSAINVDLLTGTVNGWYDVGDFGSGSVQIVATAGISAGAVFFEQTNDPSSTTGVPLEITELGISTANPITAAFTIAANTRRMFSFGTAGRYIRVRISTAFTGGTIQALAIFSQQPFSDPSINVQQANGSLLGTINLDNAWYQESVTAQAANATVTGTSRQTNSASAAGHQFSKFNAYAFSDVAGGVVRIEVSADNTNWRRATADTAVAANTPVILTIPVMTRYARVVFVNGANAQTAFILTTSFTAS